MEDIMTTRYEVQTWTLCDGWVNTWTVSDEHGCRPETFATREAAMAALAEFLCDIQDEIFAGQRDPEFGYSRADLRAVAVPAGAP
jgi:hypothetical protein